MQCEYCGKYGHDWDIHPEAREEAEHAARQQRREV